MGIGNEGGADASLFLIVFGMRYQVGDGVACWVVAYDGNRCVFIGKMMVRA